MNRAPVNVLCFKWGTAYSAAYVNRLYAGVKAHLRRPFRFVCSTDDPTGLASDVDAQPLPPPPPGWTHGWPNIFVKLCVFRDGFADLRGPTLFLDVDQLVLGDLGPFFDYETDRFCIIHNWVEWRKRIFRRAPAVGNSSCFRFRAGKMDAVYRRFVAEQEQAVDRRIYPTEQAYMTHAVGLENIAWWPDDYVRSFKRTCMRAFPLNLLLPPKPVPARILCFHGEPNPDQALAGFSRKRSGSLVGLHLRCRPAKWISEFWHD